MFFSLVYIICVVAACSIKMIGKPYYKRNSGQPRGAWMRDAAPPRGVSSQLQWNTYGINGTLLHQFASQQAMKKNATDAIYDLRQLPFEGTGHVVYNNSLYYQMQGSWRFVRYDLKKRQTVAVSQVHPQNTAYFGNEKLYKNLPGAMDFAVDETGLWVIYANHKDPAGRSDWAIDDVFFLAKLDPEILDKLKVFKLKVPMNFRGNGFMVCGTLYIVRHSDRTRTSIAWAYDAYTEKESHPKLAFSNPYGKTCQLLYDPKEKEILGWDSGKLILYPLLMRNDPL